MTKKAKKPVPKRKVKAAAPKLIPVGTIMQRYNGFDRVKILANDCGVRFGMMLPYKIEWILFNGSPAPAVDYRYNFIGWKVHYETVQARKPSGASVGKVPKRRR